MFEALDFRHLDASKRAYVVVHIVQIMLTHFVKNCMFQFTVINKLSDKLDHKQFT